jgi:hypothetical protein
VYAADAACYDDDVTETGEDGVESGEGEPLGCLEEGPDCRGPVELHLRPSDWRSFPRCDAHQAERERRRETSMERYADSDVAPSWLDPAYAGERWDEE